MPTPIPAKPRPLSIPRPLPPTPPGPQKVKKSSDLGDVALTFLILVSLTVFLVIALGLSISNTFQLIKIQRAIMLVAEQQERQMRADVAEPAKETAVIQPEVTSRGTVVATSKDGGFVLRANEKCSGVFSVSEDMSGMNFNLGWKESANVPEVQDLGAVIVQNREAYAKVPPTAPYTVAFSNDQAVVSVTVNDLALPGCVVWVAEN